MAQSTNNPARWVPGPVPQAPADLPRYLQEEFQRLAAAVALAAEGNFEPNYKLPERPAPGMVRYFDGVLCNPGAGEGWYGYSAAGTWTKLG